MESVQLIEIWPQMAKRKSKDVVLCCNVAVLSKKKDRQTPEYQTAYTVFRLTTLGTTHWVILLRELDDDYRLGNSDSVEVCLSSKKDSTEIFFPDYNEKIDVISQFILYILCDIENIQ